MGANPNKKLKLKGGGARSDSLNSVLDEYDKKFDLNPETIKYQEKSSNCCVWISAALAIDIHD